MQTEQKERFRQSLAQRLTPERIIARSLRRETEVFGGIFTGRIGILSRQIAQELEHQKALGNL